MSNTANNVGGTGWLINSACAKLTGTYVDESSPPALATSSSGGVTFQDSCFTDNDREEVR
jgi:hypothetical protein